MLDYRDDLLPSLERTGSCVKDAAGWTLYDPPDIPDFLVYEWSGGNSGRRSSALTLERASILIVLKGGGASSKIYIEDTREETEVQKGSVLFLKQGVQLSTDAEQVFVATW